MALVDDEEMYRYILDITFSLMPNIKVVGSFSNGATALKEIPTLAPDVALLDIELKDRMNGIQIGMLFRQ